MHVFPCLASLNIQVILNLSSARKGERELNAVLMHVSESAQTQNLVYFDTFLHLGHTNVQTRTK